MKKLGIIAILLGLLAFFTIVYISAISEDISDATKTYGFIALGYFGVISFSWGWFKVFHKK